jgi:aspartate aminotransferase-like enzyme
VIRASFAASLALALTACATTPDSAAPAHPEAKSYAVTPDAMGDVDAALARAAANGKRVLVVMGGNWCHESRALAGVIEEQHTSVSSVRVMRAGGVLALALISDAIRARARSRSAPVW